MINRVLKTVLWLVLLTFYPGSAIYSQDKLVEDVRVAVFPLWYNEDIEHIGPTLSETVQSTVQWIMRFIDGYQLIETGEYPSGQFEMGAYVRKNKLDNVIYGRVDYDGNVYSVSILLYDAEHDRLAVVKQGTVRRVMEIFALADDLSIELIEQFIGRKLEYGSLVFRSGGEGPGHYRVLINGIPFGEDVGEITRFLTGEYRLTIEQVNGSDHLVLEDRTIRVEKDRTLTTSFQKVRYGYLSISRKGVGARAEIIDGGRRVPFRWNRSQPVPVGKRQLVIHQLDGDGKPWTIWEGSVNVAEGETAVLAVKTVRLSRGIAFAVPSGGGFRLTVNDAPWQPGPLPAGKYTLAVTGPDDAAPRWVQTVRLGEECSGTVTLQDDGSIEWSLSNYLKPDLLLEVQTAAGSWLAAGGRAELMGGRLGLSLLAGFYMRGEYPAVSGQFKAHYILLPSAMLRPAAGVSLFYSTDFNRQEVLAGPEVELAWETGWPVVTQLYAETGLYYRFGAEEYMLNWRFAVGARLF